MNTTTVNLVHEFCTTNGIDKRDSFIEIAADFGTTVDNERDAIKLVHELLGVPLPSSESVTVKLRDTNTVTPTVVEKPATQVVVNTEIKEVSNTLSSAFEDLLNAFANKPQQVAIDEDKIISLIEQYAPKPYIKTISITVNEVQKDEVGLQHFEFERILKMLAAGINPYIYGPAGTGKTQMAENAALALGKEFYAISVCGQSSKVDLQGYMDAAGKYVPSLFRKAYEFGGVFLIDEIDAGSPNILTAMNSALANGYCAFPDGMVKKHTDFICIAAANTFGSGASITYTGRNPLDGATKDRFVQLEIGYDKNLELQLFGEDICKPVHAAREIMANEKVIISMRAMNDMRKLMSVGFSLKEAFELKVIGSMPHNLRSKLNNVI